MSSSLFIRMATCNGNGTCFNQTDLDSYEQASCSHGCELIECKYYKHCGKKLPKWVHTLHREMCPNCAAMVYDGKTKFTEIKQDCPVCYDEKYMMKLPCNYLLCLTCLYSMYDRNENIIEIENIPVAQRTKCPLCRNTIHAE